MKLPKERRMTRKSPGKDDPPRGPGPVEQTAVAAAIAVATVTLSTPLGAAVTAGLTVAPDLLRRAADRYFKDRSADRWELYLAELLRGDRAVDPRLVAKLFAESTDEHVQELVIESARVIAEALATSVMPVMARLTATYAAPPGKRADRFFRGVRRILSDLTEEEFQDMREIVRRVVNVAITPWPPWLEVRSTRHISPRRQVGDPPGEPILLVCTGFIAMPAPSSLTPSPPRQTETFELGEPPSTTTRILHLLEVNGLAVPGVSGQLNVPVPTLIESATVRRLHELLTV
jgi:hypothetical protein